ncbi:tetratricopeptide repeat protein [Flavobacteriaceae bacterium KMM 6897]|nr:tetratricopeptide repeat protein [Flavobacteriaceae bacterium KMM 6897]MEB8346098.1 tetratricopeptide repeat protein [Flavobacteriaceae bacterium KMM 6898]
MKKISFLIITMISLWGVAQNNELFDEATKAYNEGKYNAAIENYNKIIDNGEHSAALYFNLGNAYYKLNNIAPSIYYYEKSLLLDPSDNEVKNNLGFARNMTLDAIEQLPETGIGKIFSGITGFLSFDQWAITAIIFMLLFVLGYIAFYYLSYSSQKRVAFIGSMASLVISIGAVLFAYMEYNTYRSEQPAIVFENEVIVKSEPNNRSQESFRIHEGTKVFVLDTLSDWNKIKLADGKSGWLPSDNIKLLKDF